MMSYKLTTLKRNDEGHWAWVTIAEAIETLEAAFAQRSAFVSKNPDYAGIQIEKN